MNHNRTRGLMALLGVAIPLVITGCTQANAMTAISFPVVSRPLDIPPLTRITGADMPQTTRFGVAGTDLGRPFLLENGSIGYLFGDTFTISDPDAPDSGAGWRSPVILRSSQMPEAGKPLEFDSAAGLAGDGIAPEIMDNGHKSGGEYTVIPTDGVSFPETGDEIISYMSINHWTSDDSPAWVDNYAGLAWSPDGNHFYRMGPTWPETSTVDNPFQVWSMQRYDNYVFIVSTRAGRQTNPDGPMMLLRVPWTRMLDGSAYTCWDGTRWGASCVPIMTGSFGEPSLRRLKDGTWMISYLDVSRPDRYAIVTRTADSPIGTWSQPKVQLTSDQLPRLYGGYPHPWSTKDDLLLMVSTYQPHQRYDVSIFKGSL